MTDKEKLIELLNEAHDAFYANFDPMKSYMGSLADCLIANGFRLERKKATSDKTSEWISVEDRLPSRNERILVWCESKTIKKHITACTYMGDGKFSRHVRCVTHWMPLPEPPKEDTNGK
jgi:hypothetical protein